MTSAAALLLGMSGAAHPLHTTFATVEWRADRRALQVAVRMFSDDLAAGVTRSRKAPATALASDSVVCDYAAGALSVRDAANRMLSVAHCTVERVTDVTWIRLEVPAPAPVGLRIVSSFLFEVFPDQINVVQATIDGRARTILFTHGDIPKPIV